MRRLIKFDNNTPSFLSYAAVGGREERKSPLAEGFSYFDKDDKFGMDTFEEAEAELTRIALNFAFKRGNFSPSEIDALFAGDLENQCVASSCGLYTFGIPYVGLYSACSTCTEALLLISSLINSGAISRAASVTSSHNGAAERQFRTPVEYGGQRTPSAQWTATAAGAFVLGSGGNIEIKEALIGKIVDGLTRDASNMGAAMARSAFDTLYTYFSLSDVSIDEIDCIFTGDLGYVGKEILCEMLSREIPNAKEKHIDCGTILYDKSICDVHSGASGCGCSASVLASYILPAFEKKKIKNALFMSTGALMSPTSVMQGNNILGITPLIRIESKDN